MININSIVIKQIDSFRHCSEILHDKQSFDHTFRRHCLKLCPSHLICFPLYFESCALSCATLSHPLSRTQNTKQMYLVMSTIPKRKHKRSDIEANYRNETKTFWCILKKEIERFHLVQKLWIEIITFWCVPEPFKSK
jgi:hypothetical protein